MLWSQMYYYNSLDVLNALKILLRIHFLQNTQETGQIININISFLIPNIQLKYV